jgi:hypothetical protein
LIQQVRLLLATPLSRVNSLVSLRLLYIEVFSRVLHAAPALHCDCSSACGQVTFLDHFAAYVTGSLSSSTGGNSPSNQLAYLILAPKAS